MSKLIVDADECTEALRALLPVRLDSTNDVARTEELKRISRALTPVSEGGEAIPVSESAEVTYLAWREENDRLRHALQIVEADARILAHACEHDAQPPPEVVARAMAYDAGRKFGPDSKP